MRAYCSKCRRHLEIMPSEFIDANAWCEECRTIVSTSLCKVPVGYLAVVCILSIHLHVISHYT